VFPLCGDPERNVDSLIFPSLGGTEEMVGTELETPLNDLPRCRQCDALFRPGIVCLDEVPHHLKGIGQAVDNSDLALVVVTSSTVGCMQEYHTV
jgi:NAD-dependent protein deacetylase sirtuin 5